MRKGLVTLCLLLIPFVGSAEQQIYKSNSAGMLLERIAPYLRDESRWVLTVERTPRSELRRLLEDGKEVKRWEVTFDAERSQREETELDGNVLAARRTFDSRGNLLQEEEFAGGKLLRKSIMGYSGGKLRRTRSLGPDGALLSTVEYLYATDGSLRQVSRTTPAGTVQRSSVVVGSAGISEQRDSTGSDTQIVRYDASGRVVAEIHRRGDLVLSSRDLRYKAESETLESSSETAADGATTESSYDEAGRIATQTVARKDGGQETTAWTRDKDGRLVAKTRESAAGVERWSYVLDADGSVTREDYYSRGTLRKVTTWGKDGTRTEELYNAGSPFLKVYYEGDTRVREEVYVDGNVVRERKFP